TTLDKWYELVIQLDQQWRQAVAQQTWQQPAQRQPQQQQWRSPAQPVQRDPNTMQVDHSQGPIRCYNCGQTGHIAQNC
ncbi:hypothetical protein AMATHDRAFT_112521, partial [Amanita thiersii Skay4041]